MKKLIIVLAFMLILSGCGRTEAIINTESATEPEIETVPTPTAAPDFGVQEYFTAEEMEHELQFVEYRDEYLGLLGFQMYLPSDWYYGIVECIPELGERGIDFWPNGSGGEVLSLRYYPEPFGVCGTGLVEAEGELPGTGKLRVGYYDGRDYPAFISFYDSPGGWVLLNNMGEGWNAHWPDIERILSSLVLDPGVVRMSYVDEIAAQYEELSYDYLRKSFDIHTGEFTVDFCRMGGEAVHTIAVSSQGGKLEDGE